MTTNTISDADRSRSPVSLSVVLPAYNEESSVIDAVEELIAGLPLYVAEYELVAVDDGSRDMTSEHLRDLAAKHDRLRVITHQTNRGYGAAIMTGVREARKEWVLLLDADQQISIRELPAFLAASRERDVIIGYRRGRHDAFLRRVLSAGYRQLLRGALGLRMLDINCPFKLIRRDLILSVGPASEGFFIYAELLYGLAAKGAEPVQLPVLFHERRHGRSTVRFRHIWETLKELIALRKGKGGYSGGLR